MPRTNVRYAFKGLNAITGVICLATLVVCAIAFWSRIPANFLKSEVKKFKVPLNPNSVVLQSGLNYYIRSFLNPLLFPTVVTTVSYTSLCVYGFLISYNRNTTYFLIYEVLFSACLIGHLVLVGMFLKDTSSIRKQAEGVLEKLVFSYESLSSLKPSSLLLGWIMVNLKCCGYIDPYDFLDAKSFSSVDIYDGRTYNGLTTPIPCCELNNTYQIIDIGCPLRSSTGPHQYTVGCREVFGNIFVRIVTIFSYSSLLIILLGISMIACCILVLKELWQAL
uniref:Tetraspanin n=1 Tax=Schistosoma mansoni TaxID=6183 RepID=A0A5K4F1W2_SCHMA